MNNKIIPDGGKEILELDENINRVKESMRTIAKGFFYIGETLFNIRDKKLFKLKGYKNFIEFCKVEFSLSKNQAYNLVNIYERFNKPEFSEFNYSQLSEMLPLSDEQVLKIDNKMSSKKIREIKKEDSQNDEKDDIFFGEQIKVVDVEEVTPVPEGKEKEHKKEQTPKEEKKVTELKLTIANLKDEIKDLVLAKTSMDNLIKRDNEKIKKLESDNGNLVSQMYDLQKKCDNLTFENQKYISENNCLKEMVEAMKVKKSTRAKKIETETKKQS